MNEIVLARLIKFYNEHKVYFMKDVDNGIAVEHLILI